MNEGKAARGRHKKARARRAVVASTFLIKSLYAQGKNGDNPVSYPCRRGCVIYRFIPAMQYLHHFVRPSGLVLFLSKLDLSRRLPHCGHILYGPLRSLLESRQSLHHLVRPSGFLPLFLNAVFGNVRWQFGHCFSVLAEGCSAGSSVFIYPIFAASSKKVGVSDFMASSSVFSFLISGYDAG